ncbi:MAG: methyltransferase [Syntrophales bacterium]|nr:methyltransferase [Syntrophales bacterium]
MDEGRMPITAPEWTPETILRLSGDYWKTCALHAGVKLDIFTVIGEGCFSATDIAGRIKGDLRGVTMLLNALTAMNLLVHQDEGYANTPAAKPFLSKDSDHYLGYMIMHHHYLMESWSQLDKAVITGKPLRTRSSLSDAAQRESFLMGMFNIAMKVAPRIAAAVNLSQRRHLLDLGGGPGTYTIHFCRFNPQLRATVYDLPETRPFAEKTIAKFGLADRIAFAEGNYLKENIPGTYDVALLSHILHAEGPDDCRKLIRKAVSVLQPGGLILIHEFILDNTMDSPLHPALFALNMLLGTSTGQAYSEEQIMDLLTEAHVRNIRRIPIETPNDSGLIIGNISLDFPGK